MSIPFQLDQNDARPMYIQIMESIKYLIIRGEWSTGQKLPSIRELAVLLKISVITVNRAYQELEREGVIITRKGKGSFVAERTELAFEQKLAELDEHLSQVAQLSKLLNLEKEALIEKLSVLFEREM